MFLATTALTDFWDKESSGVFLGEWCKRRDRRADWDGLNYTTLQCIWNDRVRYYEAAAYVTSCCERILERLARYLNVVHGLDNNIRYWNILIGAWLIHYVHCIYDRYVHLSQAFSLFPELETIVLDKRDFKTPAKTHEAILSLCEDPYNLQVCSQLIEEMGYRFPTKRFSAKLAEPNAETQQPTLRAHLRNAVRAANSTLTRSLSWKKRGVVCDLDWPTRDVGELVRQSRFNILSLEKRTAQWKIPAATFDNKREGLRNLSAETTLERLCVNLLPQNFPTLYLEGFKEGREQGMQAYSQQFPKFAMSAVGWSYNEEFKFWAAEASQHGTQLIGVQHGGGYGVFRFAPYEIHENKLTDFYATWGWGVDGSSKYVPLPNPKLAIVRRARTDAASSGKILFAAHDEPRYLFRFHSAPVGPQASELADLEIRFLKSMPATVLSRIVFRKYPGDFGNAVREYIGNKFPDLKWDQQSSFYASVANCELVVFDHCGTGFLESLAANVPTLIFWDPERWELRGEAVPYFELLHQAGILHFTPESAASALAEISSNIGSWWLTPAVQEARRRFVKQYALESDGWAGLWLQSIRGCVSDQPPATAKYRRESI